MSSSIVLIVVFTAALAWLAVLVASSVRGGKEEIAPNLAPWLANEDLENARLERVLGFAVVLAGFLAVVMPIYFLGETDRQAGFAETFALDSIERGQHHYDDSCADCHGPAAVGGAASFVETRSGVSVTWTAPALDDIFYRYDRDEIGFWITYGRPGTPMPAWGLDGGGAMNDQNIDDLLNYLQSIQLPQNQVLGKVETNVGSAASRLAGAEDALAALIATQEQLIADTRTAPGLAADAHRIATKVANLAAGYPEDWRDGQDVPLMLDTDRDGITDDAETRIPQLIEEALELGFGAFDSALAVPNLDPRDPMTDGVTPDNEIAHLQAGNLANAALLIQVTAENLDRTLAPQEAGLAYLQASADRAHWAVDIEAVAAGSFDGDTVAAERAVNLYNAYCARCHTSGWSPGMAFAAPVGSGGFGPSLVPPRAQVQFATPDDLRAFISSGSESGIGYGVNGIGRGYMPGFGSSLSAEDLDLLVAYLWGDTLGGPEASAAETEVQP